MLILADARRIPLKDGCVQTVVTSPPYFGLRDYGVSGQIGLEETPDAYVQQLVAVFREVWRVLKDDGTLWLNLGDSYAREGGTQGGGNRQLLHMEGRQKRMSQIPDGSGLKSKDLMGIPWRVAFALQADGWFLRSDIIWAKCLSGGTVVYARTAKGEMPMTVKDMVRLDPSTVQLWDGQKWNQAVSWEPFPAKGDGLEIELRNGQRIGCTPEHRWPTSRGLVSATDLRIGDLLDSCRLPAPQSPRTPANLPDDDIGWFVGLYIAEGSQSDGTIQIASHISQVERFERIHRLALAYDGYAAMHRTGGNAATININAPVLLGVVNAYVSGKTAHDKHLCSRCWKRSDAFLRAVLEGYLSGDGHLREGGRWVLGFCQNDALASDLRVLAARIGASLRLRRTMHAMGDRRFPGWRGSLYMNPAQRKRSDYEVVAIRRSRARMFWDISLSNAPHIFALGCGVLTHNSNPMPESVTDRPTKAHEYLFLLAKSERYFYDQKAIAEQASEHKGEVLKGRDSGTGKARGMNGQADRQVNFKALECGRNRRSVWTIPTKPYSGAHFATMPEKLVEPCILAGSKVGDYVLDPFVGSGTVGAVSERLGRRWVGLDLNPTYHELAKRRTRQRGLLVELA